MMRIRQESAVGFLRNVRLIGANGLALVLVRRILDYMRGACRWCFRRASCASAIPLREEHVCVEGEADAGDMAHCRYLSC
jgi:hypothetical protein